jgi:hypothetical protein
LAATSTADANRVLNDGTIFIHLANAVQKDRSIALVIDFVVKFRALTCSVDIRVRFGTRGKFQVSRTLFVLFTWVAQFLDYWQASFGIKANGVSGLASADIVAPGIVGHAFFVFVAGLTELNVLQAESVVNVGVGTYGTDANSFATKSVPNAIIGQSAVLSDERSPVAGILGGHKV